MAKETHCKEIQLLEKRCHCWPSEDRSDEATSANAYLPMTLKDAECAAVLLFAKSFVRQTSVRIGADFSF